MKILHEYIEILNLMNIIVLTSMIVLSFLLFFLYKNKFFLIILIVHFIELGINIYNIFMNGFIKSDMVFISTISIMKVLVFTLFYKQINFKTIVNFILIFAYIGSLISLKLNCEIVSIMHLFLNIFIICFGIIEKIKLSKITLIKNKHKLKINKKYISKSIKEIQSESSLNHLLNGKIKKLNYKIESTIELLDIPVFVLDQNNNYIYGNSEFNKILCEDNIDLANFNLENYSKRKVVNYNDLINFIQNINNGEVINIDTNDNRTFEFSYNFDLINNNIVKVCTLKDVTHNIELIKILKESEEKYKKLMDILNDGIIIHNTDTVSYINDKALKLFNISTEVKKIILTQDIKDQISKNSKDKFMENLNDIKCGYKESVVNKIETEDGKVIEFITTMIILDSMPMMLSMAIDITDLEYTKERIMESEKTYKLLIQALPEGIVIINKKTGSHIYRNKSMIKILKHIGLDKFNEIVGQYKEDDEYGKFKRFSIHEKQKFNLSMAITDSRDENNLVCVVSISNSEYRVEQMVEKLNKMENKYRFKTEFLYTIASNLKKPINTIFEVNKILNNNKEQYNEKYIDNYSRVVKQNSYRLKRLLNNIEEISKIENGIIEMEYCRCDVVRFVENIVKLSEHYAKEKKLDILFITNIKKKVVLMDKSKIEKILLNLLSNAMKFTNNNGKIIVSVNSNKESVIISVEDTGVGIPNEKMNCIFENFEQIDTTLSRSAEGTGVGLALVKKLANAHNAQIRVYSKVGYGSKFDIILENNNVINLEESKEEAFKSIDVENIDIEFSDIYFDLGS